VGEGARIVDEALTRALGGGVTSRREVPFDAQQVAELGARCLAQGGGVRAEELVPRYLRRAEAEVRRTGERFEAADASGEALPHGAAFDDPDSVA
jgi:hypothetical protein